MRFQALQRAAAAADQRVLHADSIKGSAGQMPEFSAILSSSFVKELTQSQRKDTCFLVRFVWCESEAGPMAAAGTDLRITSSFLVCKD